MINSNKPCNDLLQRRKTNRATTRLLGQGPRALGLVLSAAGPLSVLALWFLVSWLGLIKPLYLPPPWRLLDAAADIEPNIAIQSCYTLSLIVLGFLLGLLLAFPAGLALRQSFIFRRLVTPIIESSRPVPIVAIVPFFILWFGFAWTGKLFLIALGTFLMVVVGVTNSIDRLDPILLRGCLSFGGTNARFLRYAALPGVLPAILPSLRIALANAVAVAVVSEYMGATRGLGHVINVALNTFSSHTIILCVIVLGLIGGLLDWLLCQVHRWAVPWAKAADEALLPSSASGIRA